MMADRSQERAVGGGVPSRPLSSAAPSFPLAMSACAVSGGARPGSPEDLQVVGDHAEPDPALHTVRPAGPTAPQSMTALERADASLAARAPAQRGACGSGALGAGLPREHDVPDAPVLSRALITDYQVCGRRPADRRLWAAAL